MGAEWAEEEGTIPAMQLWLPYEDASGARR